MARFDIYRGRGGLLLDCQSDLLAQLDTRVVVPLLPATAMIAATRLNPVFGVEGERFMMQTALILAMPVNRLAPPIASVADRHLDILSALDMLISGI